MPDSLSTHPLTIKSTEKVLGVIWESSSDSLGFRVTKSSVTALTPVCLASKVAGVFDSLGTASPLIVKATIRLRALGVQVLGWYD